MINIVVTPLNINIALNDGETLHDGLERAGIHIETPCGGTGVCGGCKVWAKEPDKIPPTPHSDISDEEEENGLRLACMAIPSFDTTIELLDNYVYDKEMRHQGQIVSGSEEKGEILVSSAIRIEAISSDKTDENTLHLFHDRTDRPVDLSHWLPSYTPKGVAIDIGTTTMVLSLVDLKSGKVIASESCLNPQVIHGHDVLSRIQYASEAKGLIELASLVQNKLNELINATCKTTQSHPNEIIDATVGANTTMLQLAAAIDPTPLGHLPFKVDINGGTNYPISQFGLITNPMAQIYVPPVMHAFVGSDISAGLLLCPEFFDNEKSVLYLDMGTNGEICINVKGKRLTTSTAAGPAFEGMGLSSGMRATHGAVEKVIVKNDQLLFQVIGDKKIKGVCGSGIVDLIAALLTTGYLDPSGRLTPKDEADCPVVHLNDQPAFRYGKKTHLTQKDIRQIQLAKGAVRTGIDLILEAVNTPCEALDKIYIAGGFGYHLNPVNMVRIGLLPDHAAEKVIFCGNASIDGSVRLLRNARERIFLEKAIHEMEHIQLADSPIFMESFVTNLNFPKQALANSEAF